jgi:hypothetical protein
MKTKQLPDDFYDWIKAQTFVIGAETVFEHGSQRAARKAGNGWCLDAIRVREAIARNPDLSHDFATRVTASFNPVEEMILNPYKYPYDPKVAWPLRR